MENREDAWPINKLKYLRFCREEESKMPLTLTATSWRSRQPVWESQSSESESGFVCLCLWVSIRIPIIATLVSGLSLSGLASASVAQSAAVWPTPSCPFKAAELRIATKYLRAFIASFRQFDGSLVAYSCCLLAEIIIKTSKKCYLQHVDSLIPLQLLISTRSRPIVCMAAISVRYSLFRLIYSLQQ